MQRSTPSDCVCVDIPDEADPDFETYHGWHGEVVGVLGNDASAEKGNERNDILYHVRLNDGENIDFRWRDLRPQ